MSEVVVPGGKKDFDSAICGLLDKASSISPNLLTVDGKALVASDILHNFVIELDMLKQVTNKQHLVFFGLHV